MDFSLIVRTFIVAVFIDFLHFNSDVFSLLPSDASLPLDGFKDASSLCSVESELAATTGQSLSGALTLVLFWCTCIIGFPVAIFLQRSPLLLKLWFPYREVIPHRYKQSA